MARARAVLDGRQNTAGPGTIIRGLQSNMHPRRKPHRLPEEAYHGPVCVSFTACEAHRKPLLANDIIHAALHERLARAASKHLCTVPIYTLMPDHLHVLVLGTDETSRPKDAMDSFKMSSGRWFRYNRPDLSFQHDFHDHIVRRHEGWASKARYIARNPWRAGLVGGERQWPYTGTIGYNLDDVLEEAFWQP